MNNLMGGVSRIMRSREKPVRRQDYEDGVAKIQAMRRQELKQKYKTSQYLPSRRCLNASAINKECRKRMCLWCYEIVDYYGLSRDTVYSAISCLDRFVATPQGQCYIFDRTLYQLACVAALYFTIKTHESVDVKPTMFMKLSHNAFSEVMITNAEHRMLFALDWAVNPPSPKAYLREFITLVQDELDPEVKCALLHLANYQAEIAVLNYKISVLYSPSEIAIACLLNACALLLHEEDVVVVKLCRSLQVLTGICKDEVSIDRIRDMLFNSPAPEDLAPLCPEMKNPVKDCGVHHTDTTIAEKASEGKHLSPATVL
jgi:hypothetical protein